MALEAGQHGTAVKWLEIALRQLQENQDEELPSSTTLDFYVRHCLGKSGDQRMNEQNKLIYHSICVQLHEHRCPGGSRKA